MSKPPRRPNYDRKLAHAIRLTDGRRIITLRDAADLLAATFGSVRAWPAFEHAIDLLMQAETTGARTDIKAARRPVPNRRIAVTHLASTIMARYFFNTASDLPPAQAAHRSAFVAFLAYCLHVTLRARLRPLAPGLTPRAVLDKLAAVKMLDVHFPTTDGRTLILTRYTELNAHQKLLVNQLNLDLPAQPPSRITASVHRAHAAAPSM